MRMANYSALLPSECVVDKEMSSKESFPIVLCSVMNFAQMLRKGVVLSACHQGPPSW